MASLNITRLEGESDEDFLRRYNREKMRIYRASKPKGGRKVRGRALGPKADGLITQEEWEAERQQVGETDDDWRKRRNRLKQARFRARNPELSAQKAASYYEAHRESEIARRQAYRAANLEKDKAYSSAYFAKNKERRTAEMRAWREENPERMREVIARWNDENRSLLNAYSAQWRKCCREQTPGWFDFALVRQFYDLAYELSQSGVAHEVDHIIPVQGRAVRGLHVQTNLRVIPQADNAKKHNAFDEAAHDALIAIFSNW